MQSNPGTQLFAVLRVRNADYLYLADLWVAVKNLFELPRIDVLATPDDHVLETSGDVDIPILPHDRQVAGVHPARRIDRRGRCLGVVPVAEHHRVASRTQLPWRPM